MSGIAGIINFDGAPVESGLIERMTAALAHRGPDGIHHWVKGPVAVGHCMLRTTTESLEETQPLTNDNQSLLLVMDGRVDNWEELRRELLGRGVTLRSRADAELVLQAYETWGRECLEHIDGDFALVIWDARQQEAFCARDRMGNKPFNYHWDGKTFAFASEPHPILALPWVPKLPNEGIVSEFLADEWYSRDETLWRDILRLVSAHWMSVSSAGLRLEQYWEPDLWKTLPYSRDEDYIEHYRELFSDTVRRLSRSHRPVAYEVSGGLDSSAIFCVAEHHRQANRLPAPGIQGYTLDFTADSEANELAYARAVGAYLGVPIQEIQPTSMALSWYAEHAEACQDFPGYPNGLMHMGLYQQAALHGETALLTGLGGDQWLEGTRAYYAEEIAQRRWADLRACFMADARMFGPRRAAGWLLRDGLLPLLPETIKVALRPLAQQLHRDEIRGAYWLSPEMQARLAPRRAANQSHQSRHVHSRGQLHLFNTLYYAFDALGRELCERHSAYAGIEIRHPLLTAQFVQYAFSTPERLRLRGGRNKYVHVEALQRLMPQAVLERTTKADFSGVTSRYLNRMKKTFTQDLPQTRDHWLDQNGMARLFQSYLDDPHQGWQNWALWNIFGCDLTLRRP